MNTESWTEEEIAIAREAVSAHRVQVERENYQASRLEYFHQIENGDSIDFYDRGEVVSGTVFAYGSEAGWARIGDYETRFGFMDIVTIWRNGEAV